MRTLYRHVETAKGPRSDRVAEAAAGLALSPNLDERATRTRSRRKNMRLDQAKLDQVKQLLEAKTETDAVEQALDLVLFRREVLSGLQRIAGRGIARDVHARRP